jgi:hypothetical protein
MSGLKSKVKVAPAVPFLVEFKPLHCLWEGPQAPYPSEHSARWALRKLHGKLGLAEAVAIHRGSLYIHPERFARVAEQAAIMEFSAKATGVAE